MPMRPNVDVGRVVPEFDAIKIRLASRHGISHATVEPEYGRCADAQADH